MDIGAVDLILNIEIGPDNLADVMVVGADACQQRNRPQSASAARSASVLMTTLW